METSATPDRISELEAQVEALQRWKNWVHDYLDSHGVPHHPPGTHGAAGCRIGDRMDWLMARLAEVWIDRAAEREKRRAAEGREAELRVALGEAADQVRAWGCYADGYHRSKWDLKGNIERLRKLAAPAGPGEADTAKGTCEATLAEALRAMLDAVSDLGDDARAEFHEPTVEAAGAALAEYVAQPAGDRAAGAVGEKPCTN